MVVLDNLSPQVHKDNSHLFSLIQGQVNFIEGSVLNSKDWERALEKVDAVVHLAAETGVGQSMYEIERYTDVNIKGSSIFMDILANKKTNIKKIIIASSRAIYGEGKYKCKKHGEVYPEGRNEADMSEGKFSVKCPHCNESVELMATDENSKIHPSSIYGITKQVQEQVFLTMGKYLNIPTVSLRFQNIYGEGQSLSNPYTGILSIFSTRIKKNKNINIFEDGKERRDFVHIDDAVNATILAIENNTINYEAFNVGSGYPMKIKEVAKLLIKNLKSNVNVNISGNFRLGDIRNNFADLTKVTDNLGYIPKVSIEEGIRRFSEWVNEQDVADDKYEESIEEMKKRKLYH